MTAPQLSPEIVTAVNNAARTYNVDPNLIFAIGQLETQWGKAGDGRRGMYTGYGSFDSGSDYRYAGLQNQVNGTAKKMAQWGMSPGNVSLERLQAGNTGKLPSGIYATAQHWPGAVYNLYKQFAGGNTMPAGNSLTPTPAPQQQRQPLMPDRMALYKAVGIFGNKDDGATTGNPIIDDIFKDDPLTRNILAMRRQRSYAPQPQQTTNPLMPTHGNYTGSSNYSMLSGDIDGSNQILLQRLAALAQAYGKPVTINSGYRSPEEQQAIWDRTPVSRRGKYVAAPGKSNHNKGMAVDIGDDWLKALTNAELAKYGLRKPMDYENWHIEMLR